MADELRAGTIDTLPERPDLSSKDVDWGANPLAPLQPGQPPYTGRPGINNVVPLGPQGGPQAGAPSLQPQQGAPPAPNQDPFKPKPGILGNGVIEGTPQAGAPAATPETYAQAVAKKLTALPQPQQQPRAPINNLIYALRHTNPNTAYSRIPLPLGFKGFQGF